MNKKLNIFALIVCCATFACNGGEFQGADGSDVSRSNNANFDGKGFSNFDSDNDNQALTQDQNPTQDVTAISKDSGLSSNDGSANGSGGLSNNSGAAINDPAKCWFAVSGGYFGWWNDGQLNQGAFPGTLSGNPISHGERFDAVGGIYLNASDSPYIYNAGNHEIDDAYNKTFDSIVVTPGMSVEIRNTSGAVLYNGSGPYMAISSDYGNTTYLVSTFLRSVSAQMPAWMRTYLEGKNYIVQMIPLHHASWVKVSKIPNQRCD